VDAQARTPDHREALRCALQRGARVAPAGTAGVLQPETREACRRARRGGYRALETAHLACAKKSPSAKGG
jgi:hypothetical protein